MRSRTGNRWRNFLFQQRRAQLIRLGFVAILLLLPFMIGPSASSFAAHLEAQSAGLSVSSPSFPSGGEIPKKFTCSGVDISPQLTWTEPPAGTKTFALLVDDPDAPAGSWNHWAMWNLPASARSVPEGVGKSPRLPDGSQQGLNDFRKIGYNGPCPPANKVHRYHFQLFALDTKLGLSADAGKPELKAAMKGHILAQAEWMGTFHR